MAGTITCIFHLGLSYPYFKAEIAFISVLFLAWQIFILICQNRNASDLAKGNVEYISLTPVPSDESDYC